MNKKNVIILIVIIIVIISFGTLIVGLLTNHKDSKDNVPSEINWMEYNDGINKAKEENKPIMIFFYADWEYYSNLMNDTVLIDKGVLKRSVQFICIRINIDSYPDIGILHNITRYPTLIFLNSDGFMLNTIFGYASSDIVIEEMDNTLEII